MHLKQLDKISVENNSFISAKEGKRSASETSNGTLDSRHESLDSRQLPGRLYKKVMYSSDTALILFNIPVDATKRNGSDKFY